MPKKTTVLIIILTIITGLLVYLALKNDQNMQKITTTPPSVTIIPTQKVEKTALLSFSPTTIIANPSQNSADIIIDTNGKPINAVQVELLYDPKSLSNVKITPAQNADSFFGTQSVILVNSQNPESGRISYAIVAGGISSTPKIGKGIIGTISFTPNPNNTSPTKIQFLDTSVVSSEGMTTSVLKSTSPLSINSK